MRYGNIDYLMKMRFEKGRKLIIVALEKNAEEKLWEQWLTVYPLMVRKEVKYISFKDYLKPSKPIEKTNKTTQELIEQAEKIKKADLKSVNSTKKVGEKDRTI